MKARAGEDGSQRAYSMELRAAAAEATRERILEAAADSFMEHWYDDVTIASVAKQAGVSGQTVLNHFGGSHAQRDALQRTLVDSALRAGDLSLARVLIAERLSLRESSVYAWNQRARWLRAMDETAAADQAAARAGALQARFAAATAA